MKTFKLQFFCADEKEYEGECEEVMVPLSDGSAGILAGHSNMIAALMPGTLTIRNGSEITEYAVTEGLLEVKQGSVVILAFSAEKPDEIDEKRAQEARERAETRMKRKLSQLEYRQTQAALARAMNRLKVKHRGE